MRRDAKGETVVEIVFYNIKAFRYFILFYWANNLHLRAFRANKDNTLSRVRQTRFQSFTPFWKRYQIPSTLRMKFIVYLWIFAPSELSSNSSSWSHCFWASVDSGFSLIKATIFFFIATFLSSNLMTKFFRNSNARSSPVCKKLALRTNFSRPGPGSVVGSRCLIRL